MKWIKISLTVKQQIFISYDATDPGTATGTGTNRSWDYGSETKPSPCSHFTPAPNSTSSKQTGKEIAEWNKLVIQKRSWYEAQSDSKPCPHLPEVVLSIKEGIYIWKVTGRIGVRSNKSKKRPHEFSSYLPPEDICRGQNWLMIFPEH